jgi:hypothetical protein
LLKKTEEDNMPAQFINMLQELTGLLVGAIFGIGFGMVQDAAWRRNERKQAEGKLNTGWSLMPGSGARVAYFLIVLLLVQLVCPLLFRDGIQWWVSGGEAGGYGLMLFLQLRRRLKENK